MLLSFCRVNQSLIRRQLFWFLGSGDSVFLCFWGFADSANVETFSRIIPQDYLDSVKDEIRYTVNLKRYEM